MSTLNSYGNVGTDSYPNDKLCEDQFPVHLS